MAFLKGYYGSHWALYSQSKEINFTNGGEKDASVII